MDAVCGIINNIEVRIGYYVQWINNTKQGNKREKETKYYIQKHIAGIRSGTVV